MFFHQPFILLFSFIQLDILPKKIFTKIHDVIKPAD